MEGSWEVMGWPCFLFGRKGLVKAIVLENFAEFFKVFLKMLARIPSWLWIAGCQDLYQARLALLFGDDFAGLAEGKSMG